MSDLRKFVLNVDAIAEFYTRKNGHLTQTMRLIAGTDINKTLEQEWSRRKGSRCIVRCKNGVMMDIRRSVFFTFMRIGYLNSKQRAL